ncbi:MAG: hypothetical protein JXR84_19740 [Anaerolineae bacterium]|nr:hypothetical protein [Anaerolineae bacterium]
MKSRLDQHFLAAKWRWLCVVGILSSTLACRLLQGTSEPTPTPLAVVGLDELRFDDAEIGRRFRALDACIREITADGWRTTDYKLIGNFYSSRWCRGAGARDDCQIASGTRNNRDQHVIELETFFYPSSYPQVFGLKLAALWVPEQDGWGVHFSFSEDGGDFYGDGAAIGFSQYETDSREPAASVSVIGPLTYRLFETGVALPPETLSAREELALYLVSPEALRDEGLAQIQALASQVDETLRTHQVTACDRSPYEGDGIEPPCTPRPLIPEEEAEELARAATYFDEQQHLLRENYQEMYAALMQAFPLDRCWP